MMPSEVDCRFCPEFRGLIRHTEFHSYAGSAFGSRLLRSTANFVVFPTLGPIVDGHLLISPKTHYLSIGHCPAALHEELGALVLETRHRLRAVYKHEVIAFEHGAMSPVAKAGCCIEHAHLHILPGDADIREVLRRRYAEMPIAHWRDTERFVAHNTGYLLFQDKAEVLTGFEASAVPSQLLRRLVAEKLGVQERWDWRHEKGVEMISKMLNDLSDWRNYESGTP